MTKATYRQIPELLRNRQEFTGNSMRAEWRRWEPTTGQLDRDEAAELRRAFNDAARFDRDVYVVFSYATPIAWRIGTICHVTEQGFSQTTTRQQNLCRAWLS